MSQLEAKMDVLRKYQENELDPSSKPEATQQLKNETIQQLNRLNHIAPDIDDEIDLFELLKVIWKWKYFLLLSVILGIGSVNLFVMITNQPKYITELAISLNFNGIEKHHNPDGSLFDKNQVIAPHIISKAGIQIGDKETDDIDSMPYYDFISIKAILPIHIQDTLNNESKKNEIFNYFPNRFFISITTDGNGIKISNDDKAEILYSLIDEYKKDFYNRFIDQPLRFGSIADNFLSSADYLEAIQIITIKIDSVMIFLDNKSKETGSFRSTVNKLSFFDIKDELLLLRNTKLTKAQAIINNSYLSKNRDLFIIQLKQNIKDMELKIEKAKGKAIIARRLLKDTSGRKMVDRTTNQSTSNIVLETSFIEKLRAEDSASFLLKYILNSDTEANDLNAEKERAIETLTRFEQGKYNSPLDSANIRYVENSLSYIVQKYNKLNQDLIKLYNEFLMTKFENSIKVIQEPHSYVQNSVNLSIRITIITLAASISISLLLVFFIEYINDYKKFKKQL